MRKNMTRGIAAGALVLAMGLPIGAYAAPGDDWAPGAGDCEMSEEVRAAFENNPELQALREARQADATQFRAEHRATQDPDAREARQAEAAQSREQYREKVEAQLEGDDQWGTYPGGDFSYWARKGAVVIRAEWAGEYVGDIVSTQPDSHDQLRSTVLDALGKA